jgi:HAD superfamily hydrolase (TIGR01450 family)
MKNDLNQILKEKKYFLLDMDGTIYIDDELIGEMTNTLNLLRSKGKQIIYLTNNSSKSASEYISKLNKLKLWHKGDIIYTSGMATIEYLKNNHSGKSIFLVGTTALKNEFLNEGLILSEKKSDIAVLSYDTEITYEKLCKITNYITKGALYIATHPDINCPSKDVFLPDIGSFIKLIEVSTGKLPEVICGKPYKYMGDSIKSYLKAENNEIVMIGDRLITDIAFGNNNNFTSILVYSGETTKLQYEKSNIKADYQLNSLNEIINYM